MAKHSTTYYDGTEEYLAVLQRQKQYMQDVVVRRALLEGGRVLLDEEIGRALFLNESPARSPETTALPLGAIADGLRMVAREYEGQQQVVIGPNAKTAHVAAFVELGHALVKKTKSGPEVIGDVGPHPFLRPAYEASIEGVFETVRDSMREGIQEVTRGR